MKIIIDNKIPYIKGVLEPYAEVVYLPGNLTGAEEVKDAEALITRTRTICNKAVLKGSKVRFIATATIGFDHIDTDFCKTAGIEWANAPGCNAESVNQYITSALFSYSTRNKYALEGKTIGIVGVGQVGSRVAATCETLGMRVLRNDPPRERMEGSSGFVSLQTLQQHSDIISLHVPLNRGGVDNTFHMVDMEFIRNLGKKPFLINTCRGEVFDTMAVCRARKASRLAGLIIDCWEDEPDLDLGFLGLTDYGTPHIAGYSKDGKANGTKASIRAISKFFGLGMDDWDPPRVEPPACPVIELDGSEINSDLILANVILSTYEINHDDRALRDNPQRFEQLRVDYPVRREFDSHSIKARNVKPEILVKLAKLGFKISLDSV